MAYFIHAYQKTMLGTKGIFQGKTSGGEAVDSYLWDLVDKDVAEPGMIGFFTAYGKAGADKDKVMTAESESEPFYIAASPLRPNDFIGQFAGNYRDPNRTKIINPSYVNKIWKVLPNNSEQAVLNIGNVASKQCSVDYSCNMHYYLRVDVKGTAAMSALNHNAYLQLDGFVNCCDRDEEHFALVGDGVEIYAQWVEQLAESILMKDLVKCYVMYNGEGYAYDAKQAAELGLEKTLEDIDISEAEDTDYAGMVIVGAYEDTKFGNCTFQTRDSFTLQPLRLYASPTDLSGDPCWTRCENFVVNANNASQKGYATGVQENGSGELILREMVLEESYHQRHFSNDLRIREIEGATELFGVVDREKKYVSYYILHSVPRTRNHTSVLDNDQYCIKIILENDATVINSFEAIINKLIPDVEIESDLTPIGEQQRQDAIPSVTVAETATGTIPATGTSTITVAATTSDSSDLAFDFTAQTGVTVSTTKTGLSVKVASTASAGTFDIKVYSAKDVNKEKAKTVKVTLTAA